MDASVGEYDFQTIAIKAVFGGLPLEKRRKLVGELLDMSQVLAPCIFEVPLLDPKYLKWIRTDETKHFTEEDILQLFLI